MRFIKLILLTLLIAYSANHFGIISLTPKSQQTQEEKSIEQTLQEAIVAKGIMSQTELDNTIVKRRKNQLAQVTQYYANQEANYIQRLDKQIEIMKSGIVNDEIRLGECRSSCDKIKLAMSIKTAKLEQMNASKQDSLINLKKSKEERLDTLKNAYRKKLHKLVLSKKG